ncbi:hypothetical protein ACZ11_19875 [Lysinibacillus xylanilyticus]|uniref:Uncharacterized protein n=1 Tax=Lysinibacillus xylanilyticus TaxID=582475 RepID=A0A0K9F5B5_9BACI|nr:hypothetical protein [Lysinibacillus xylanilyticus]KMY29363.1 hypothetical protein ACZ11_19875 [Lysinibacillus xylanilyticus]
MYKHKNWFIVATTNIIVICLIQIIYLLMLSNTIETFIFDITIFPLIIASINIILWFSKFKLKFSRHVLWAYVASLLSFIISYILIIDPNKETTLGEVDGDSIYIMMNTVMQSIVLLVLTGILYIAKIIFTKKNKKILEEGC